KDVFDREWGVVQRELEMLSSNPDAQLMNLFSELRYQVHPARYPVSGHQAILQQVTRDEILAYYKKMYVPDNCVLVISGDINASEMLAVIKQEFADFTRRSLPHLVMPTEPDVVSPRELVKVFPSLQGPARMLIGFPSVALQHEDLYALDVLAGVLGAGESSRLYRILRDRQLALATQVFNDTPAWAKGTFTIFSILDPSQTVAAREAIDQELERIQNEPVTVEELARIKRQLQVAHIRANQTAEEQAETMAIDYLATGDPHFSEHYVDNIQEVTASEVQAMAQKYLLKEKQITLIMASAALEVDETAADDKAVESPIKKIMLDNGMRVLLKRNPSVPLVDMQYYVMGGLLEETGVNNGLASLMAAMSTKGTRHHSGAEISEYFDGIGGTVSASAGNNTIAYSSEVMSQDFAEAFDLFAEVVLEPNFPEDELVKVKEMQLAAIAQVDNSWPDEARAFFREKFFVNSPYVRSSLGILESVECLTAEQLRAFHEQAVVGSRSVLTIFGDINLGVAEDLVRQRFSDISKGAVLDFGQFEAAPEIEESRRFTKETPKQGATIYVGYPGMKLTDIKDRYAMEVLTEIMGSTTSNDWLFGRLRGKQLVYYAWCYNFPGLLDGYVAATCQCEADKVDEVLKEIEGLLGKAVKGEFTEEEVSRAKSNRINAEVLNKQTNADSATSAALDELYGFGYDWSEGHSDRIMAVTLEDVRNVARKYFNGPATITVITSVSG
ncbi:MAG: insulinase family protein, partial [Planctomycetes bacterium]|nr:insulinase family protein [Planctomycetota bacterium]